MRLLPNHQPPKFWLFFFEKLVMRSLSLFITFAFTALMVYAVGEPHLLFPTFVTP